MQHVVNAVTMYVLTTTWADGKGKGCTIAASVSHCDHFCHAWLLSCSALCGAIVKGRSLQYLYLLLSDSQI